jgi:hypothetical protein
MASRTFPKEDDLNKMKKSVYQNQTSLFGSNGQESVKNKYWVDKIKSYETHWFLLNKHYAQRIPSISFSFGLFFNEELVGVVTYGKPASPSLCRGICGKQYESEVLELNRLSLLNNNKNEASILISQSLKMLPKPSIVVSYADTSQNHVGIVYQATNWIYTGLSVKAKNWSIRGMEHMHSRAITHLGNLESLKKQFGDDFYYRERPQKHRYICFVGNKKQVEERKNELRYKSLPYPKS